MNNNYLILDFNDAKVFRKIGRDGVNLGSKDIAINGLEYIRRDEVPSFIEPITVHQVSNMLHVLFNERPVPSLRVSNYKRIEYYFNKANESYIKIDTPKILNNALTDVMDYYGESCTLRKALSNSWNPSVTVSWEIAKRYVGDEDKFNQVVELLNTVTGVDVRSLSFVSVRDLVQNLDIESSKLLDSKIVAMGGIGGMVDYFGTFDSKSNKYRKPSDSRMTSKPETAIMVNTGIDKVIKLSGKILIPVNDDDIIKLRSSKGCATILDGGMVTIVGIVNANDLSIDGFTAVNEISDSKSPAAASRNFNKNL